MKTSILPDNFLRCMDAKDLKPMGKAGRTNPEIEAANASQMEKSLQALVRQYLNLRGIAFINPPMHKRSQLPKGWPDFTFCINGQACAIECKTLDGKLSEDQERAIAAMRANCWAVEVCTSIQQAIGFVNRNMKG